MTLADEMKAIKKGQKYVEACGGFHGPIACRFHDGRAVIDQDENDVLVMSPDIGFQLDCPECTLQAFLTLEHIAAVRTHDAATEILHGKAQRYTPENEQPSHAERFDPPKLMASGK